MRRRGGGRSLSRIWGPLGDPWPIRERSWARPRGSISRINLQGRLRGDSIQGRSGADPGSMRGRSGADLLSTSVRSWADLGSSRVRFRVDFGSFRVSIRMHPGPRPESGCGRSGVDPGFLGRSGVTSVVDFGSIRIRLGVDLGSGVHLESSWDRSVPGSMPGVDRNSIHGDRVSI